MKTRIISWKVRRSRSDGYAAVVLIYYALKSEICDNECEIDIFTNDRDGRDGIPTGKLKSTLVCR